MSDPRSLLRRAEAALGAGGVASPAHDAAELLAHVLGTTRGNLVLIDDVAEDARRRFEALIARRTAREPLQHLTGMAAFRHVELSVGPGVFVPRPETELLAGWAIDLARDWESPVVIDLCSGSGAIARSIADELPNATVHALEVDPGALPWTRENLRGTDITLHEADLADAPSSLDGSVDIVVCNPPYIPLEAWESVSAEARDHDPHLALFSGDDGLDAMRVLERVAARLLKPGGWVGAEHADVQGESAPAVFSATGRWTTVRDHRDLAGRDRYLTARLAR